MVNAEAVSGEGSERNGDLGGMPLAEYAIGYLIWEVEENRV